MKAQESGTYVFASELGWMAVAWSGEALTRLTYGDLSAAAGAPGAARAVGNVMAQNRYPIIVPCHRVVGSAGSLGGFSARDGISMKRRMLEMEGAEIGQTRRTRRAPRREKEFA